MLYEYLPMINILYTSHFPDFPHAPEYMFLFVLTVKKTKAEKYFPKAPTEPSFSLKPKQHVKDHSRPSIKNSTTRLIQTKWNGLPKNDMV